VRFGACRPPDDAALAAQQGWDFVELPFGQLGVLDDPAACDAVKAKLAAAGMQAESVHRFLPPQLRLVGDDLDREAVQRYVETALARVATLGGRLAVFSGGRGRTLPEGFARERGQEQFVDILRRAGDAAAAHGITLAVSPLNRRETNFITTVPEGAEIVRAADHPAVRLIADLYHMVLAHVLTSRRARKGEEGREAARERASGGDRRLSGGGCLWRRGEFDSGIPWDGTVAAPGGARGGVATGFWWAGGGAD
jgi:sugar phosphate isomerase/epimerase